MGFSIVDGEKTVPILVERESFSGIRRIAGVLADDICSVCRKKPEVIDESGLESYTGKELIICAVYGKSDMLSRLETMVIMGIEMPLKAVRAQIASGIDVIVHLGRLRDRSRRVLEIDEVQGIIDGEIQLGKIFEFKEIGENNGKIVGRLERTDNTFLHVEKLEAGGIKPEELYGKDCK